MARFLRAAILIACFLYAGNAFAAGRECPSGANYLNSTGALVTLASLGVTNCYYIAANGADTNTGTSESSPWLHAPGMPNCSSACAAVAPTGGEGFIIRGGDTWHFGNSGASPYTGGTWTWQWNGSSGNPIYIGVDQNWFSGGSWSRPILNADNPLTPNPGAYGASVASCPYQVGSSNDFVSFGDTSYNTFDNFEMTGLCQNDTGAPFAHDIYVTESAGSNNTYEHLYIHGWSHVAFSCSGTTGHCFNLFAFLGSNVSGDQHIQIVIDGSDSDPGGLGAMFGGGYNVSQSVFRYVTQIVLTHSHIWHDNLFEHWYGVSDGQAHANLWEEVGEASGTNAIYNNVFRNVCDAGNCPGGIVGIWPEPSVGTTEYWFNNLVYDQNSGGNYFDIGQNSGNQGALVIFNNTFEQPSNGNAIFNCANSSATRSFIAANNHLITDSGSAYSSACSSQSTLVTNLTMTHATATKNGYTSSQTYAYSPMSASSPTAATAGTNEQSYCAALSAAGLSDAYSACRSDNSYACTYNSTNHTLSCPSRTVLARPNGSWDIGAYQYSGTQASIPNPPANLTATVN